VVWWHADCVLGTCSVVCWCAATVGRPAVLSLVPTFLVCCTDTAAIVHCSKSRLSLTSRSAVALSMLWASEQAIGDVLCADITTATGWLTGEQVTAATDRLASRWQQLLTDWRAGDSSYWLTGEQVTAATDWLANRWQQLLTDWRTGDSIYWLTDWLANRWQQLLTDWLTDWRTGDSSYWLTDW